MRDTRTAEWHGRVVLDADPETFRELSPFFAADASRVFGFCSHEHKVFRLTLADAASFTLLNETYARDASRVYFADHRFGAFDDEVDITSFVPLSRWYAKDRGKVYAGYDDVNGIDPARAHVTDQGFVSDGTTTYFGIRPLAAIDEKIEVPASRQIDPIVLATNAGVYMVEPYAAAKAAPFSDVDPTTFAAIGRGYYRDARRIFYGRDHVMGADVQSFALIDGYFAKDARAVYYLSQRVPDADPHTFRRFGAPQVDTSWLDLSDDARVDAERNIAQAFSLFFGRDATGVFYQVFRFRGIDPDTFRVIHWDSFGESFISDRAGTYSIQRITQWYKKKDPAPRKIKDPRATSNGSASRGTPVGARRQLAPELTADDQAVFVRGRRVKDANPRHVRTYAGSFLYFTDESAVWWYAPHYREPVIRLEQVDAASFIAPFGDKQYGTDRHCLYDCGTVNRDAQERWRRHIQEWRSGVLTDEEFDGRVHELGDGTTSWMRELLGRVASGYWWCDDDQPGAPPTGSSRLRRLGGDYWTDEAALYHGDEPVALAKKIRGGDWRTFEVLSTDFAKDARSVYVHGRRITKADPSTFTFLFRHQDIVDYARDGRHVHCASGQKVHDTLDPSTFRRLDLHYARDHARIFCLSDARIVASADAPTFEVVPDTGLAFDARSFFHLGGKISRRDFDLLRAEHQPVNSAGTVALTALPADAIESIGAAALAEAKRYLDVARAPGKNADAVIAYMHPALVKAAGGKRAIKAARRQLDDRTASSADASLAMSELIIDDVHSVGRIGQQTVAILRAGAPVAYRGQRIGTLHVSVVALQRPEATPPNPAWAFISGDRSQLVIVAESVDRQLAHLELPEPTVGLGDAAPVAYASESDLKRALGDARFEVRQASLQPEVAKLAGELWAILRSMI